MDEGFVLILLVTAAVGCLLVYAILSHRSTERVHPRLAPITILPLSSGNPEVRAYLDLLAGQIAWMDSSVMQSLVLVYGDGDAETASLCEEMSRKYDFVLSMSLTDAKKLLENRVITQNAAP